jgi:alpha-glucosidase
MLPDAPARSVAVQRADPRSPLALHRRLLALRRGSPALTAGTWAPVAAPAGVIAYDRVAATGGCVRVVLNLRHEAALVGIDGRWTVRLASGLDREGEGVTARLKLRADEGVVLEPAG